MGRAIVREPAVFLFDEPLSNLDAKLRVQMRVEIKKLQRRLRTTSIYVTHDQVEAMTMADRLVVMNKGIAEQVGTPMEVYTRPATSFVASFIGSPSMNFFDGVVTPDALGVTVAGDAVLALGQDVAGTGPSAGARVTVGVRPEHLELDPSGSVCLSVDLAEPLGAETLVHGSLDAGGEPVTVRLGEERRFEPGEVLCVTPGAGRVHLFDPDSGLRV
jgi:sn-glycerol 3-phosphate transport system ATP-binding protein